MKAREPKVKLGEQFCLPLCQAWGGRTEKNNNKSRNGATPIPSLVKILYPLLPLQIHSLFLNVIQSTKYSTPLKRILSTPDPFSTPLQKVKTINVSLTD